MAGSGLPSQARLVAREQLLADDSHPVATEPRSKHHLGCDTSESSLAITLTGSNCDQAARLLPWVDRV